MNDRKLKQILRTIYRPPGPARKRSFLDSIEVSRRSVPQFVLSQISYIRPWVWMASAFIFAAAMTVMWNHKPEEIGVVSALLPFVALSTLVELNRSAHYKMEELELSSRFSLKAVMLARMSVLGLGNFLVLLALSPFAVRWMYLSLVETGFFILCPYCLATFLSLVIIRRWRNRNNVYACAGVSAAVSALCCVSDRLISLIRASNTFMLAEITVILLMLMIWEYRMYLSGTEEYAWN